MSLDPGLTTNTRGMTLFVINDELAKIMVPVSIPTTLGKVEKRASTVDGVERRVRRG